MWPTDSLSFLGITAAVTVSVLLRSLPRAARLTPCRLWRDEPSSKEVSNSTSESEAPTLSLSIHGCNVARAP